MKLALCIAAIALLLPACGKIDKPGIQITEADFKSFLLASQNGSIDRLKEFLAKGVDVNAKDVKGNAAIHHAVCAADTKALELLLQNGAEVNAKTDDGVTALHMAAFCGKMAFVKLLVVNGADCQTLDDRGVAPHIDAARTGSFEIFNYLLDQGCKPDIILHHDGSNLLHQVASAAGPRRDDREDQYLKICKTLLDKGVDANASDKEGKTPLHRAAESGFKEIAKLLLEKGVSPDTADSKLVTTLHLAVKNLRYDTTQLLINEGAYINAEDDEGRTPLDYAQTQEMKDLLTRQGALIGKELKGEKEE